MEPDITDVPPPKVKRGRGRPRKHPLPPPPPPVAYDPPPDVYDQPPLMEYLMPDEQVDTRDIARATPGPPPPMYAAEEEAEVIHLPREDADDTEPRPARASTPLPPPPPPPMPMEDTAARKAVSTKIRRYRESFDAVRAMTFNPDWSIEKLNAHLDEIRIVVGSKTTHVLVKHSYLALVKGVEIGTCAIKMKTYGLTELISKSSEIDSILKECAAEMGIGAVPPGHRLALATVGAVLQLDSANRRNEVLAGFKKEAINETIPLKYDDL